MKGMVADSITIRVGQGILTIPRNIDKAQKGKKSSIELEKLKDSIEVKEQTSNEPNSR